MGLKELAREAAFSGLTTFSVITSPTPEIEPPQPTPIPECVIPARIAGVPTLVPCNSDLGMQMREIERQLAEENIRLEEEQRSMNRRRELLGYGVIALIFTAYSGYVFWKHLRRNP